MSDTTNYTYEYLPRRGLTRDTLRFYDIKTKIDPEGKPVSVGYPWENGAIHVRTLGQKGFYWVKNEAGEIGKGLFGKERFPAGCHQCLTITEGEDDAASLYQVLRSPVVSVQNAGSAKRDCIVDHDYINSFERIYLAFDSDAPGREALDGVAELFDYNKLRVVRFTPRKDANDYLQVGEETNLLNIWNRAKKYSPEAIISSLEEFKDILATKTNLGIPYPFPTLTKMTYGIRTGETVVLTAQEKVGKTSIMREILYKLLTETNDAIGAIFLEEPKLRLLQAVAGRHLHRPVHLPDSGASPDELYRALQETVVHDDRLHIYSHFGSDDPDVLLDCIRFLVTARNVKYVLFDHITMAVSGSSSEADERRSLDYLATRLEMMVKELDFALIMVSHVNDEGKTRGSRLITKVADIVINAQRDPLAIDPVERNTIHLTIPYNRFCAMSGPAGDLMLDTDTYILSEVPANDNLDLSSVVAA